ncbi:hypothetical protein [Mucilaginibacter sp. SP1R1]|uniref:hypothetical protein n=1 Tax=Mucilaginibacter sp. SP1R1 TaxID=2723091 RepID=UPI00161F4176|nr:hypothetical protein [Mucilaginibacter sp. SP1R1]MBB6151839.1 hypothetical protein [Mucilaginibacter sp. SP1R1]
MVTLKRAFFVVLLLVTACKKPTENLKIVVNTDIIKYTALIHVTDAAKPGVSPANATISITGNNADDIYEVSGKKQFKLTGGIIAIGPGPAATPTAADPESCIVQIKAPGYVTVSQPVTFNAGQQQQVVNISLVKSGSVNTSVPAPKPPPVYEPVTLNFTGTCKSRTDVEIKPSIYVFYRETGTDAAYQYLGYMDKGNISVTALAQGKTYDFQLTYGGQNYMVSQQINLQSYDLTIDMGTVCNDF